MSSKGITVSSKGIDTDIAEAMVEPILAQLVYIGEMAVNEARSKFKANDWHDVTGNLRASIGYVVLRDGAVYREGLPQPYDGGGADGAAQGQALLAAQRRQHPKGLVLIVCAGMDYASYVEARGYNVLTSAEQKAEVLVEDLLQQLQRA